MADEVFCSPVIPEELENLEVDYLPGRTTDRTLLESLSIENYQHILILSYSDALGPQEADSSTLMTLLHIRT